MEPCGVISLNLDGVEYVRDASDETIRDWAVIEGDPDAWGDAPSPRFES